MADMKSVVAFVGALLAAAGIGYVGYNAVEQLNNNSLV